MLKYLRSVQTLVVFEAAGRHRSFKKAGGELHVTPSAVSRQIAMLEEDLGVRLFRRLHRGLELTEAGAAYLAEVSEALARLDRAGDAVRVRHETGTLRISVLQSFAGNWLIPRLPRFESAYPHIDVRLEATTAYADFRHDEVDLAIRFGTGPWRGLHSEPLLDLEFFPVCHRDLARRKPGLREPRDLARHTWLEEVHVPDAWPVWLRAAGVQDLRPARRLHYDNAQLMLEAAVVGQGVALATDLLADRFLRERRLIRPFAVSARSALTYHLVGRTDDLQKATIRAFRTWIRAEMDAWRANAAAPARVRVPQPRMRKDRLSRGRRAR